MKPLSERIAEACSSHDIYSILGFDPSKKVFLCPMPQHLHKNHTPSFSVFTRKKKQFFKCHGNCDLEGDVVDLIGYMRVAGYNRRTPSLIDQALKLLDDRYEYHPPVIKKEVRLTGSEWRDFLPPGPEVIRYAASRGLNEETLARFKIGQCGHYMSMPCFEEGILVGIKMRNINPCDPSFRFWQLEGSRQGLFNYDQVYLSSKPVFVVKGEIPCMLLVQLGFSACAPTGGEAGWMERYRTALAVSPRMVIGDNDPVGRKLGEKRAKLLGAQLYFPPETFKDVDAWVITDQEESTTKLNQWGLETQNDWW